MEKVINNKIIAISGEPVSGKGTTVECLIGKLVQNGYSEENIHVISTGNQFREYFNDIVDFIKNSDNFEKLKSFSDSTIIKIFMENKEYRDILTQTIIKIKNENINLNKFSVEDANNNKEFKEIRKIIDKTIDERMKTIGEEINEKERPDEIWIIDSRLAFDNIKSAFSVRLTTNADIAAERLFNDTKRGKEDKYETKEQAKEEREKRRIGEIKRYKERYQIDLEYLDNYNLVIDTSYSTINDIADVILQGAEYYYNGKYFPKTWASPKIFLPLQTERDTLGETTSGYNIDTLYQSIKQDGFIPSNAIETIEVDGIKYIIEGHHRNFALAMAGKTLIPYKMIGRDDEEIEYYGGANARTRAKALRKEYLINHEWLIEHGQSKSFSYKDIYPDIYEQFKEEMEH